MNSHIIDSRYLGDLFGAEELGRVFSDIAQLQSWLDFEAALAHAELIDMDALHEGVNFTGHPLISLVQQLTDLGGGDVAAREVRGTPGRT